MAAWSKDELQKIAERDDLHVSPLREDGSTYGTPTSICPVAVDDVLYVRAYNGQDSHWYQAVLRQNAGRIAAPGFTKDVTFEPIDGKINDLVDEAYRSKYNGSQYPAPVTGEPARFATFRIMPRENGAHSMPSWMTQLLTAARFKRK
jgi:hypothetical protein